MPSVLVSEHSDLPPEVVLAAARDFSDRRAEMWPDVHVEYLQVHEVGEDYAEVTEGNPWPIGYVWERLHYDWSDPQALRGRVIDSNLFKPGSTWELWAIPEDGGSRVEIRAVRHLRGRGWLLAPFFLPLPFVSRPRPCESICATFSAASKRRTRTKAVRHSRTGPRSDHQPLINNSGRIANISGGARYRHVRLGCVLT